MSTRVFDSNSRYFGRIVDLNQAIHVQVGGVAGAFQHFHERFRGVVTWAKRQRGDGGINHIGASFDGLHELD